MNIIENSEGYQALDDIADIILRIEFPKETIEKYEFVSTTAFVTYKINEGNSTMVFDYITLVDEGFGTTLEFTKEEKTKIFKYIQERKLETKLLNIIKKRNEK